MSTAQKARKKSAPKFEDLFLTAAESAKGSLKRLKAGGERVHVAANLFDLRMKAGLSQRELAEKASVGFRTLQRVEIDPGYSPSLDVLGRIGVALRVPTERLLKKADLKKIYNL